MIKIVSHIISSREQTLLSVLIYQRVNSLANMKSIEPRLPLRTYVIIVLIVWVIVLFIVSRLSPLNLMTAVILGIGFFLGMLYMYLRMRVSHLDK